MGVVSLLQPVRWVDQLQDDTIQHFQTQRNLNVALDVVRGFAPPRSGFAPVKGSTIQWKRSPPSPGSLKALLFPPLPNKVQNERTQGVRARYDVELPPFCHIEFVYLGKSKRGLINAGLSPKFSERTGGKSALQNQAFSGLIGTFPRPVSGFSGVGPIPLHLTATGKEQKLPQKSLWPNWRLSGRAPVCQAPV